MYTKPVDKVDKSVNNLFKHVSGVDNNVEIKWGQNRIMLIDMCIKETRR